MKKILITATGMIMAAGCTKPLSSKVATNTSNSFTNRDTMTMVDNGTTFTYTGALTPCDIHKTPTNAHFILVANTNDASTFPINISLAGAAGPASGLGVYKMAPIDSGAALGCECGPFGNQFEELLNGVWVSYTVDSVMFDITQATGNDSTLGVGVIKGNYQVWLSNANGNKTVVGRISCNNAYIAGPY